MSGLWLFVAQEDIWLTKNLTWKDVEDMPGYPKGNDLYLAIPMAVLLSVLRFVVERWVFLPIGNSFGIRKQKCRLQPNSALEKAYKKNINNKELEQLAQEINLTVRQIEIWFRRKKSDAMAMKKFTEGAWRLTYYSMAVIYGILTAKDLPWSNIADCFPESVADQVATERIRWYYLTQIGFYTSLCITLLSDVRRKDFKMMVFHHIYTIALLTFSWLSNTIYIGCLVMVTHDVGDVPLEAAKLFKYAKKETLANVAFFVFVVTWFVTRLGYYPFLIIGGVMHAGSYLSPFCFYILSSLQIALFGLHLVWTWFVIKVLYLVLKKDGKTKDVRSDDEASSCDELEDEDK